MINPQRIEEIQVLVKTIKGTTAADTIILTESDVMVNALGSNIQLPSTVAVGMQFMVMRTMIPS